MSVATIDAIEAAILAHLRDTTDAEEKPERAGAVITGWVVGFELSNLVDVGEQHGGTVVGYANSFVMSDSSPNLLSSIAHWVGSEIEAHINGADDVDNDD